MEPLPDYEELIRRSVTGDFPSGEYESSIGRHLERHQQLGTPRRYPENNTTPPRNRRSLFSRPPDAPYISRPRRRRRITRISISRQKLIKEKIQGNTTVTPNHLIRFLIFGERKQALTTIRKDSLYYTITAMKQKIPKSANLGRLLEKLSILYDYENRKEKILQNIVRIQGYIRIFLKNRLKRIKGPGFPITKCVNEDCPYSLETLGDIPSDKIITWREPFRGIPSKIYGCDIDMMIDSLRRDIHPSNVRKLQNPRTRHGERIMNLKNPFTREGLTVDVIRRCNEYTILKKQTPLYPSSDPEIDRSRSRTTTAHRGLRRVNVRDDDDMINERHISTTDSPNLLIDPWTEVSPESPPRIAIRRLEGLLPHAEAVSESLRDLEFYTQDTMFTKPITDTIGFLRRIEDSSAGIELSEFDEISSYIRTHVLPLADTLAVGLNYPIVSSIINRICEINPSLRGALRDTLSLLRRNRTERPRWLSTLTPGSARTRSREFVIWVVNIVGALITRVLLLAHASLKTFTELSSEEDRKSFAIILIGTFCEAGYLSEEFSWARFVI